VEVALHELDLEVRVEIVRRHDVEHRGACDLLGVIEQHAMRHASTAVLSDDRELVEAEMLHDFDLVERHGALRVVLVVRAVGRLAAVAIAAEIRPR
jgi:hypothetical protein